jgi:murein DD-endopeptidase MepM/ murein hydrolase activator NlpD
MMTIAVYLIAAYPTREFDSGSWIGSCWSVNSSAPPSVFSHNADWKQLIGSDVIELKASGCRVACLALGAASAILMSKRAGAGVAEDLAGIKQAIDEQFGVISDRVADLTAKYRGEQAAAKELAVLGQTPNATGGGALQVCPVAGLNSFVDSFGWPRVGHTHQGIDLISPAGTPVVAAHAGTVSHSSSTSGGIQAYVHGSAGYSFYAHLSGYSSASGSVSAGTVIGYVGSTGNSGVNHLHFEWHPGGGAAVKPVPDAASRLLAGAAPCRARCDAFS